MTDQQATTTDLDRRRDKMQSTMSAATAAAAQVDALDQQLAANAERHTGLEADLQATLDRVAALKKSAKASTKERGLLRAQRKDAGRDAARTQDRARRAEAKYDTAVLADMLRREKDNDLSAHAAPTSRTEQAGTDGDTPRPARSTATRTAARATAARAGTGTGTGKDAKPTA